MFGHRFSMKESRTEAMRATAIGVYSAARASVVVRVHWTSVGPFGIASGKPQKRLPLSFGCGRLAAPLIFDHKFHGLYGWLLPTPPFPSQPWRRDLPLLHAEIRPAESTCGRSFEKRTLALLRSAG